ncbi:hypothetical protein JRO89_XS09G0167500 [Xanthoceras sorbifolium]|uniref:CCHC-type domain-containing protein n=1 Tax=Xanthoceras sorbifolium TaxID=99658 RepID=A0ABQ8HLN5_9ROSI|nr:hypothetical protein JRO89_XS09G0167500 [Xanthoceras sorbifolium]
MLLRYEKLPNHCFCCGKLGHLFRECLNKPCEGDVMDQAYDSWLRAFSPLKSRPSRMERSPQRGIFGGFDPSEIPVAECNKESEFGQFTFAAEGLSKQYPPKPVLNVKESTTETIVGDPHIDKGKGVASQTVSKGLKLVLMETHPFLRKQTWK